MSVVVIALNALDSLGIDRLGHARPDSVERFLATLLVALPAECSVLVTSDHGHLEQVSTQGGRPKSPVPTWVSGADALASARTLTRPEAIFEFVRRASTT